MNEYIAKNEYLTRAEMEINARVIWDYFIDAGWSPSAIAAMLGNMETESTINPGIHENLDNTSTDNGFGLVQWTPKTKLTEWLDSKGVTDHANIYEQLARIQYERDNGLQWIETDAYPVSFMEFSMMQATPEAMAQAFLYNYERPAELVQWNRSEQARAWFNMFAHKDIEKTEKKSGMSKVLLYAGGIMKRK